MGLLALIARDDYTMPGVTFFTPGEDRRSCLPISRTRILHRYPGNQSDAHSE